MYNTFDASLSISVQVVHGQCSVLDSPADSCSTHLYQTLFCSSIRDAFLFLLLCFSSLRSTLSIRSPVLDTSYTCEGASVFGLACFGLFCYLDSHPFFHRPHITERWNRILLSHRLQRQGCSLYDLVSLFFVTIAPEDSHRGISGQSHHRSTSG